MAPMGKFKKKSKCHNSGCMRDRVVIFGSRVGFSGTPYLMAPLKITPGWPMLPWQQNLRHYVKIMWKLRFFGMV